jgi:hypothetical protein
MSSRILRFTSQFLGREWHDHARIWTYLGNRVGV